eukprot:CAMPEP_0181133254 /NCGR_PEP_ID=MMETSP1071-20121207/31431_1 /TAXON_ID=35127 /ORGANISM="Thalassiosira sp., Strain NH16" /LENGTH=415 /DNA_ID=CAMNT_0023219643 /DNA_START=52 /DNA_END=1295 /DNA_ORIENTATION=-
MPCSYFVLTDPAAHPLGNVNEHVIEDWESELPDPGSLESHYFCGATFLEAAASCSSRTWCRTGTNQECPNGQTCFVGVNVDDPQCEINAIVKAEHNLQQAEAAASDAVPAPVVPTAKPTNSPLGRSDPKNRMFCGTSWNDAGDNCMLERFCPNGDEDCPDGMECHDYTTCDAWGLTYMPTKAPTPAPTEDPTKQPINTTPTQKPTTAKPSRDPTPNPTGVPTPKPTGVPSKRPTHQPLAYGDFRREFWCGLSWFDAMDNCAVKCPSGQDEECPGSLDCKNEMGMGAYETGSPTTAKPSRSPTKRPQAETIVFNSLGSRPSSGGASKPSGGVMPGASAAIAATVEAVPATPEVYDVDSLINDVEDVVVPPLQGPYDKEMVRIILYGIDSNSFDDDALEQWKYWTKMYMEDFYNNYP